MQSDGIAPVARTVCRIYRLMDYAMSARRSMRRAGPPVLGIRQLLQPVASRTALKMGTGWPTFPMVVVNAVLVGGAKELARLLSSGDLTRLLTKQANNAG